MGEVIKLLDNFYAQCQCGSQNFRLAVDGPGDTWKRVLGTECCGCGYIINWIVVTKTKEKEDGG